MTYEQAYSQELSRLMSMGISIDKAALQAMRYAAQVVKGN